jgi:cyclase
MATVSNPHDPHAHDSAPDPTVEEVADGVFGYLQLDGQWGLNNSAFVVGRDGVTVVDTCFTERRTRALIEAMGRVTKQPARTLVNTHEHGDHTWGNWLLPDATVIGHVRCREGILSGGLAAQALFPGVEWGRIELRPPSVTFADRLELWVDELRMDIVYVGPAHTPSDVVCWLPDRGVLLAGDIVFHGGTPFVLMGSITGSLTALEQVASLGASVIVPGHGRVAGPEVLDDQIAYLRFVQDLARQGREAGIGPLAAAEEARRSGQLEPFAMWHDSERLVGNLHRAYAELDGAEPGAPIDLLAGIAGMIEFNGGRPLRCLA